MEMYLDYIGYAASLIVLISLLMSSLKKLRWINLVGALVFGFYGFMIGSIPTGMMNLGIVVIDIYYLVKMYQAKEFFKILPIENDSEYLNEFINFYNEDIKSYTNLTEFKIEEADFKFYVLRNLTPAGLFVANAYNNDTIEISIDYVVPQFRDFKIGNYVFNSQRETFTDANFKKFIVFTSNPDHIKYVLRMGFKQSIDNGKNCYIKEI